MRLSRGVVIAIGVLSSGAAVASEQSETLEPSSSWVLDYADERCTLARTFGSGSGTATLQIVSFGSYSSFRIFVFGSALPASNSSVSQIRYGLSADETERDKVTSLNGNVESGPAIAFTGSFRAYKPKRDSEKEPIEQRLTLSAEVESPIIDFESQITSLTVDLNDDTRLDLRLGGMAAPLAAIRDCIDNLRGSWGLDPVQERMLTRYPVPDMKSVRRLQRNYPAAMIRAEMNAYVPIRIMVDEHGRAGECKVSLPAVRAEFKKAACGGLATRYSPALDKSGQPVASVFTTSVIYILR